MSRFFKLTKRQARERFALGKLLYLCRPCDVPSYPFNQAALMNPNDYREFEELVQRWQECNSTVVQPHFYYESEPQ